MPALPLENPTPGISLFGPPVRGVSNERHLLFGAVPIPLDFVPIGDRPLSAPTDRNVAVLAEGGHFLLGGETQYVSGTA